MMKNSGKINRKARLSQVAALLGEDLVGMLSLIRSRRNGSIYLTGGTVRDLLLDRVPMDIDLTVREDARGWAADFSEMTGGTLVPLGRDEDAARVVWQKRDIDFSSFREGAATIDAELTKRDITINSLAVSLREVLDTRFPGPEETEVIDPAGGLDDLEQGLIRVTSEYAFRSDPLRLLRVFRFAAALGFTVESRTRNLVERQREWISRPAPERVAYELGLIMKTDLAYAAFREMSATGLLFEVIPELKPAVGMEQPASHHLDVFDHSLATLRHMELIQENPGCFFPAGHERMEEYIRAGRHRVQLKWAALFHDLGKPPTIAIEEDRGGRITFYNHDRAGAELVGEIAGRLRWSREDEKAVANLVGLHMRPFFLCNVRRKEELTVKACLRLLRAAESDLPGLFLLGMADAAAGQGEDRPEEMEREMAELFAHLEQIRKKHMEPVRSGPPLLTGKDLLDELQLEPGPIFRKILEAVEEAHMENAISSREEALALAGRVLKKCTTAGE
ncbi:MAG: HD domain-containing protein [Desulfobulbaceae bacterium]|nr:HD domain-containing protein [Desulfobulbaceae bacterium]